MQVSFDLLSIIITLGITQGVFLSAVIITSPYGNRKANILMGCFTVAYSISISGAVIYKTGLFYYMPHLLLITEPFRVCIGPLLYLYVLALTRNSFEWKHTYLLHFIPFALTIVFLTPIYVMGTEDKIHFFLIHIDSHSVVYMNFVRISIFLIVLQVYFYILVILKIIRCHEKKIKQAFSDIDMINLSWIRFFIRAFFIACTAVFCIVIISQIFGLRNEVRFVPAIVALAFYGIAYRVLRQPPIIIGAASDPIGRKNEGGYIKPPLPDDENKMYLKKLYHIMEEEKPHLNPEITIHQLSEKMKTPVYIVSRLINETIGLNFYQFINGYRVEEVKKRMYGDTGKLHTILEIALDAGFNSKATFNAVFKQTTGITPSQFRKKII